MLETLQSLLYRLKLVVCLNQYASQAYTLPISSTFPPWPRDFREALDKVQASEHLDSCQGGKIMDHLAVSRYNGPQPFQVKE
jgi:hypothetical protein